MTLPSSGQISLSNIRSELSSSGQITLASASLGYYVTINTASAQYPNNSAPYSMNEWYGYNQNAVALTSFLMSATGDPDEPSACPLTPDTTYYHNGANAYPQVGDYVYTDSAGNTPFNSAGNYYKVADGNVISTDAFGQVQTQAGCR